VGMGQYDGDGVRMGTVTAGMGRVQGQWWWG